MAALNPISTRKTFAAPNLAGMFQVAREKFEQHRIYRQTLSELSALSNRELADLGLHRSMLKSVALEAAYGQN
ncbi:DUF1127 domain-containing protein [Phaeobacter sp. HF9A]|nr:DUF1127 domain-containing protein [Phaeobacter sp. HF9A]NIZ15374.1 DUF1127 domain-containing protein [Phaeobacter sp. HF9A]